MAVALPKSAKTPRPWEKCRGEPKGRLLEPGYAGSLDDDELAYIQGKLKADPDLAYWWGWRPGQKSRAEAAIRRVAMYGDPDCRAANIKLARSRPKPSQISHDKAA
jgi:hypothetical protein